MKHFAWALDIKRGIAAVFILSGIIYTTYSIKENAQTIRKLGQLESGIQTCFMRVNQSFTAYLISDKTSNYLTSNFQSMTEECFAEGMLALEANLKSNLGNVIKKLGLLSSNVHWFHEDLLAPSGKGTEIDKREKGIRNVGLRFEKIELSKEEIMESIGASNIQINNKINRAKIVFYILSTLMFLLMIFELMVRAKNKWFNLAREIEASGELQVNDGVESVKIGEIVRTALIQNDLPQCARLFTNFYSFSMNEKEKRRLTKEELIVPAVGTNHSAEIIDRIESLWLKDDVGYNVDEIFDNATSSTLNLSNEVINLEKAHGVYSTLLADKLFSQGIKLEFNFGNNTNVLSRKELLDEALYHLILFAVNSTGNEKRISIDANRLGDVVTYDLNFSGKGLKNAVIKENVGLTSGDELDLELDSENDIDFKIFTSLVREMRLKYQLDNKLDQRGKIIGGRCKIIFKAASVQVKQNDLIAEDNIFEVGSHKLVDLKVGTKKEILANM